MNSVQETSYTEKAIAGKYRRLYAHLSGLQSKEWNASFTEIEAIIGFGLPVSARRYTAWWANEKGDSRHSQSIAWTAAGWETADVDMGAETLSFRESGSRKTAHTPMLDKIWPARSAGGWPEG